jgi:hypothetical protein
MLGLETGGVLERQERGQVLPRSQIDRAAIAAVTAIGTAQRDELFTTE